MRIFSVPNRGNPTLFSATGGFSLVELLAVLVILSLVGIVVVLSVPSTRPVAEESAISLAVKMRAAQDLAIMRGMTIGMKRQEWAISFWRFSDKGWVPLAERRSPLSNLSIGPEIEISFQPVLEAPIGTLGMGTLGQSSLLDVTEEEDRQFGEEAEMIEPEIIFSPTGDANRAIILLREGRTVWRVVPDEVQGFKAEQAP